jgi:hypothetical protein
MAIFIKGNGFKIKKVVEVNFIVKFLTNTTKVNSKMENQKDSVF